jgi:hypothetical protein
MRATVLISVAIAATSAEVIARETPSRDSEQVSLEVIAEQRKNLAKSTAGEGYGPQSPRDIEATYGANPVVFRPAPASSEMNLCDIHFHKYAEHKGGEFTKYAGPGDGKGYYTGYEYSGELTDAEVAPVDQEVCPSEHGSLSPGDTIEAHYVYTTAQVEPGPGLGSCFTPEVQNPQLRVEAQVYVLVNDDKARDFGELAKHEKKDGFHQALNIPEDTGEPVQYAGSTTGPAFNEVGSPFQVTWNVRPEVAKVDIKTVGEWCEGNVFNEDHAHGSRNLVINPHLLSKIEQ